MNISNKREALTLFLGDIAVFVASLWLMLLVRYGEVPSGELFQKHLVPFLVIFIFWVLVFFIAGLYEKHTTLFKSRLPSILFNAQLANSVIAVLFFYFLPFFGINPKINLFLFLVIFFLLILGWRVYGSEMLGFKKREKAILVGSGEEMKELLEEINGNQKYSIYFATSLDISGVDVDDAERRILDFVSKEKITTVVIDLQSDKVQSILPRLYDLVFSRVKFIDMYKVYEDTFDRIPISILGYDWLLQNISRQTHVGYDFLKRLMDVVISFVLGVVSLFLYPFVYIAIKIEDGGVIFSYQERIGRNNEPIHIMKFRTMTVANDAARWGQVDNKITKVGAFLRKTRIDELPQLWNVLKGDISLVGPRPEFETAVAEYGKSIPYYNVRHIIKPGLSGWAQMYGKDPHHGVGIEETRNKLSYDLYYIKNRSFMLDLKIALQTVKILVSMVGK